MSAAAGPAPAPTRRARRARWRGAWQRSSRRWRHSLGLRRVALFVALALALALAMSVIFVLGMQAALRSGWQGYAGPLIADCIDTLAAQIGTPPDAAKAQALTERLPLRIRIDGPSVNWSSHAGGRLDARHEARHSGQPASPRRPVRVLADGHRISFGLAAPFRDVSRDVSPDDSPEDRPRLIGGATLAALLLLIGLAYAVVHRCCDRWPTSAPARCATARAISRSRSGPAAATNSAIWPSAPTAWPRRCTTGWRPSAACCWRSATSCVRH